MTITNLTKSVKVAAATMMTFLSLTASAQVGVVGFANISDMNLDGTTGGGQGPIIHVTNRAQLQEACSNDNPCIIVIDNDIEGEGRKGNQDRLFIGSNKTILGAGAGKKISRISVEANRKENIIIRNLEITNGFPDAIAFRSVHHVWIDHCDVSSSADGLLDFTLGSSYVTVSYCKVHNHDKVSICNSGTQHAEDVGRERVTYHHNWFADNVQRNPRIGYGIGHIFNTYYTDISGYAIGYFNHAQLLSENNYFERCAKPYRQMYSKDSFAASYGELSSRGDIHVDCGDISDANHTDFRPEQWYTYDFALEATAGVPANAKSMCGPQEGIACDIIGFPGNGKTDVSDLTQLSWNAVDGVKHYLVSFGTDVKKMRTVKVTKPVMDVKDIKPSTTYYWSVTAVMANGKKHAGCTYRFTTLADKPSSPMPADGTTKANLRVSPDVARGAYGPNTGSSIPLNLQWRKALSATEYKVYLTDKSAISDGDIIGSTKENSIAAPELVIGRTYRWRVDAVKADGSVVRGAEWTFSAAASYAKEGRTECENMTLGALTYLEKPSPSYFKASNDLVTVGEAGACSVAALWAGNDCVADIDICYLDEKDGQCPYTLVVAGRPVDSWKAAKNTEALEIHHVSNVTLHRGDEIRIEYRTNRGMMGRTDYIEITPKSK